VRLAEHHEKLGRLENAVAALWEARAIDPSTAPVESRLKSLYARLAEGTR
jgi:hypothetical protein